MEKRILKSHSGSSRESGLNVLTSGELESASSVKKLSYPVSQRRVVSSSVSGIKGKPPSSSQTKKEKEPVRTNNRQVGDTNNTHSSRESVVEVLSPLRTDKDSSIVDEETKDLIGEYRRRLYQRGSDAPLTQVQKLEEDLTLQDSSVQPKNSTSYHHKSHGKKSAKHTHTCHKPLYGLQYNPDHQTDRGHSNGRILEKLMSDIIKRIHSYESNYYKGIWCDKNNFFRSRPKVDIKLQQRTIVPYDDDIIPPSELRVHISTLKQDMSRMDACSSYRLSCLEQLMKLNRLLQSTEGFVRVRDLRKKGIPFVRTEPSHSSSTDMSKTSFSETYGSGKYRKTGMPSYEETLLNVKKYASDFSSNKKVRSSGKRDYATGHIFVKDKHVKLKKRKLEHRNQSTGTQTKHLQSSKDKEIHLPPLVSGEKEDIKMECVSSSEDGGSSQEQDNCGGMTISTESAVVYDGDKTVGTKAKVISEKIQKHMRKSQFTYFKRTCDASTQSDDVSCQLARRMSVREHKDDLKTYVTGGADLRTMGKGQLLLAVKNLVETPYYKLDSVIYKLRKELEYLEYSQKDKQIGTEKEKDQLLPWLTTIPHTARKSCEEVLTPAIKKSLDETIMRKQVSRSTSASASGQRLLNSPPTIPTLPKHVVQDYVFDKDKTKHSMTPLVCIAGGDLKTGAAESFTIEEGQHSLHSVRKDSFTPSVVSSRRDDTQISQSSSGSSSDLTTRPSKATCNFRQLKGETYYMYVREDGSTYFSMISPQEKGETSYTSYLGSYIHTEDNKMVLVSTPCKMPTELLSQKSEHYAQISPSTSDFSMSMPLSTFPGYNYYKYKKKDGTCFLTTLSPKTWGPTCPHKYVKAYREIKSGVMVPIQTDSTKSMNECPRSTSNLLEYKSSSNNDDFDFPLLEQDYRKLLQEMKGKSRDQQSSSKPISSPLLRKQKDEAINEDALRGKRSEMKACDNISAKGNLEVSSQDVAASRKSSLQDSLKESVTMTTQDLVAEQDKIKEPQRREVGDKTGNTSSRKCEGHDLEKQNNHQMMPEKSISKNENDKEQDYPAQDKLQCVKHVAKDPDEHQPLKPKLNSSKIHSTQDKLQKVKIDADSCAPEIVKKGKHDSNVKPKNLSKSHSGTRPISSKLHKKKNDDAIDDKTGTSERAKLCSASSSTPASPRGSAKHSAKGKCSKKLSKESKLNETDVGRKDSKKMLMESLSPRKVYLPQQKSKSPKGRRKHKDAHHKRSDVNSGSNKSSSEGRQEQSTLLKEPDIAKEVGKKVVHDITFDSADTPNSYSLSRNQTTEKIQFCETRNSSEQVVEENDEGGQPSQLKEREFEDVMKPMATKDKNTIEPGVETTTESIFHSLAHSHSAEQYSKTSETLSDEVLEAKDCDLHSLSSVNGELQAIQLSSSSESSIEEELEEDDISPAYSPVKVGCEGVNIIVVSSNDQLIEANDITTADVAAGFPTSAECEGRNIKLLKKQRRLQDGDDKPDTNDIGEEQSWIEDSHPLPRQVKQFHNHSMPSSDFFEDRIEDSLTPQKNEGESLPDTSGQDTSSCNGKGESQSQAYVFNDESNPRSGVYNDRVSPHQPLKYRVRIYKRPPTNMTASNVSENYNVSNHSSPEETQPPTVSIFPSLSEKKNHYTDVSSKHSCSKQLLEQSVEDMNSVPANKTNAEMIRGVDIKISQHENDTSVVEEGECSEESDCGKFHEKSLPIQDCEEATSLSTSTRKLQEMCSSSNEEGIVVNEKEDNTELFQKGFDQACLRNCSSDYAATDTQSRALCYSIAHRRKSDEKCIMLPPLQSINRHNTQTSEAKSNSILYTLKEQQQSIGSSMEETISEKMKNEDFGEDSSLSHVPQLAKSSSREGKLRNVFKRMVDQLNIQNPDTMRRYNNVRRAHCCGRACRSEHILRPQLDLPGIKRSSRSLEEFRKIKISFKNPKQFLTSTNENGTDAKSSLENISDDENIGVDKPLTCFTNNCSLANHSSYDFPSGDVQDKSKLDNF